MKNILKFGLALAIVAFAAFPENAEANCGCNNECCCATECNACGCQAYDAYFRALWLLPCCGGLDYAVEATTVPSDSPDWCIHEINPDYAFGFDVGVGTIFCGDNTNLFVEWQHFHSSASASRIVDPSTNIIGPLFEIGPDATPYQKAHGHVDFDYDEVNIDYGVLCNVGCRLRTNIFAGVSAAHIRQKLKTRFSTLDETIVRTIDSPRSFTGAGPHVGFSATYRLCNGFHLAGEAEAALLVGGHKNHNHYTSLVSSALQNKTIPVGNPPQETCGGHRIGVVPWFGGRVGFGYCLEFCNCYKLSLEAGYEARIYINAIESFDIGSQIDDTSTAAVYARTFNRNVRDFALAGPYVSLKVTF